MSVTIAEENISDRVRLISLQGTLDAPNAMAIGLRKSQSHLIGFVTDEIATTPFAGQIIRGAQDAAREQGDDRKGGLAQPPLLLEGVAEHDTEPGVLAAGIGTGIRRAAEFP